jgi:hypothetical protein
METLPSVPSAPVARPQPKIWRVIAYYALPFLIGPLVGVLSSFLPEPAVAVLGLASSILIIGIGMWLLGIINLLVINLLTLPFGLFGVVTLLYQIIQSGSGGSIISFVILPVLAGVVGSVIALALFCSIAYWVRRRILKITTPDSTFFQMRYPFVTLVIIALIPAVLLFLAHIPMLLMQTFN